MCHSPAAGGAWNALIEPKIILVMPNNLKNMDCIHVEGRKASIVWTLYILSFVTVDNEARI